MDPTYTLIFSLNLIILDKLSKNPYLYMKYYLTD
nr:MAG TPA: hypothetical protein [Bacteriophage sp.]